MKAWRCWTAPLWIVVFLAVFNLLADQTSAENQTRAPGKSTVAASSDPVQEQFVTIDFNDVDIGVLVKFISELTGKNFVVDNQVKGKVTIISPAKISIDEAYRVFESVLEVNGFATVPAGEVTKIVPMPEARSKNIETHFDAGTARTGEAPEDKTVTQLIPLKFADANEIKQLFTPLISKNSAILSYPATNTLIVTDAYSNIRRLMNILKIIDIQGIGQEISVIPLLYADAEKMVKNLQTIFRPTKDPKNPASRDVVQFVSDERTNTLITMASENDTVRIKKLVEILDKETPRGKGKIRVYYLSNATAEDLAKVLQEVPKKQTTGKQEGGKPAEAPIVSGDVRITADKATNSLIIMADAEDYLVLEEIIRKLDIPRSMVYIESLLMEVNVTKAFNIGVKWSVLGSTDINGQPAGIGGAFGSGTSVGPGDFFSTSTTGTTATVSGVATNGLSLGVISSPFELNIGGQTLTLPNLTAIANALQTDKDVRILSTPQILTTDNEEATIVVGKNIPFQTKSSSSANSVIGETYTSYEYKDVGLTLKITPQINKDGQVRLKLSQELTALDGTPNPDSPKPTTFKRSVDTMVIVQDQGTVVIGGLIDDTFSNDVTKVPCLGDVPFLGRFFRSMGQSNLKTNLYIFITPRVIKNPSEAAAIATQKQKEVNLVQDGNVKMFGTQETMPAATPGSPSGISPVEPE
ncbi:MAG: type II secretion system secretin GspD [Pseudomonadota bacterium]